jgi:hypothetical protein
LHPLLILILAMPLVLVLGGSGPRPTAPPRRLPRIIQALVQPLLPKGRIF